MGVSYLDYRDWKDNTRTFETFGAYSGTIANVSDEGQPPERFNGSHMSANGLTILGTTPVLGRNFVAEDDRRGAAAVVIIGHGMWQNRYGSNPSVIGRTIRVNDTPATVIGVMPEGFKFPSTPILDAARADSESEEGKRNTVSCRPSASRTWRHATQAQSD